MTLRVEDLKPGDVVRVDLVRVDLVVRGNNGVRVSMACDGGWFDDAFLAAGNAERVQRPRPVRKGDEVAHPAMGRAEFIGHLAGVAYAANHKGVALWDSVVGGLWAHANGDPIDWEASG